ncbi:MAG: hypothetical protein ACQEV0_14975 [Bacillota bacterium]
MRDLKIGFIRNLRKKENIKEFEAKKLRNIYLDTISNVWEGLFEINHKISTLYVESFDYFLKDRYKKPSVKPIEGNIYMANLLLGYNGEASLMHPVLIISTLGGKSFVIPGSSSDDYTENAFHWKDNNKLKKPINFLINPEESLTGNNRMLNNPTGFRIENALFISNARMVESTPMGHIEIDSITFLKIKERLQNIIYDEKAEHFKAELLLETKKNKQLKRVLFKLKKKKLIRKKPFGKVFYYFS